MLREKDKRGILNNLVSLNIQDGVENFFGDERIRFSWGDCSRKNKKGGELGNSKGKGRVRSDFLSLFMFEKKCDKICHIIIF